MSLTFEGASMSVCRSKPNIGRTTTALRNRLQMIVTQNADLITTDRMLVAARDLRDSSHLDYICTVCMEFLADPTKTICNHIFCRDCLEQALQVNPICPSCRRSVQLTQIQPAQVMEQKMTTHVLDCSRCNQQFKPIDGREHDANCVDEFFPESVTFVTSTGLNLAANIQVFPCAYCGAQNFSREGLLAHCEMLHQNAPNHRLVCTICVAFPWGDKNQVSRHLLDYIRLRHQFDYDRFVDLQEDEEESLEKAIAESMA